jgi:hypothetical protein
MRILTYRFNGLSPLLMANIESIGRGLPSVKLGTKPNEGDLDKIAEGMTYRDDDGNLVMPTQAFRSSLLTGCAGQKFAGSKQGPKAILQALLFPVERYAVLTDANGEPLHEIETQVDSAVNRKEKSRVIAVRARIMTWQTVIPFELDEEFAPKNTDEFLEATLKIWNRAGRMAGVGAWRPEKQGRYGKYQVTDEAATAKKVKPIRAATVTETVKPMRKRATSKPGRGEYTGGIVEYS